MNVLEAIQSRRSIRHFTGRRIPDESINAVIEAGIWAPSGMNNQPWRFVIMRSNAVKETLSQFTAYARIVKEADVCIGVFYHIPSGYHRDKDLMGIGACIQNMLLAAHAVGLGAVWLGEILNNKQKVHDMCALAEDYELMAVVAVGYPDEHGNSSRSSFDSFIIKKM